MYLLIQICVCFIEFNWFIYLFFYLLIQIETYLLMNTFFLSSIWPKSFHQAQYYHDFFVTECEYIWVLYKCVCVCVCVGVSSFNAETTDISGCVYVMILI